MQPAPVELQPVRFVPKEPLKTVKVPWTLVLAPSSKQQTHTYSLNTNVPNEFSFHEVVERGPSTNREWG